MYSRNPWISPQYQISRGKAAELIERIKEYQAAQKVLDYKVVAVKSEANWPLKIPWLSMESRESTISMCPLNYSKDKQYGLVVALRKENQ